MTHHIAAILCIGLFSHIVSADCALERAPVKTVTDTQASDVRLLPLPATIATLHSIPAPRPLPHDARIAPAETTIHSVTATLVAYRLTPQSEIHLVLSDDKRRTIIATIPSPACAGDSRFFAEISRVRTAFDQRYIATDAFKEVRRAVEVQGVGFFDFSQGQRGLAPNGLSLHPVTAINFFPLLQPKPPPPVGRRRAVGSGGARACPRPSLTLTASRGSACVGEPVTLSWHASHEAASVTIDGIGVGLPASGSHAVAASASTVYSGRAMTPCGSSDEALAVVTLATAASAALGGPPSVTYGSNITLSVSVHGVLSWTLSSSLGNLITPSSDTTSRTVTYGGARIGTDIVTLSTAGGTCGNVTAKASIIVKEPPYKDPDPPPPLGLMCCDGTRSPKCFSCSNKQGCCSGHKGVCGCK